MEILKFECFQSNRNNKTLPNIVFLIQVWQAISEISGSPIIVAEKWQRKRNLQLRKCGLCDNYQQMCRCNFIFQQFWLDPIVCDSCELSPNIVSRKLKVHRPQRLKECFSCVYDTISLCSKYTLHDINYQYISFWNMNLFIPYQAEECLLNKLSIRMSF